MAESYSVTAVLSAIDKNFSSTYKKAEANAKSLEKSIGTVGTRAEAQAKKVQAAFATIGSTFQKVGGNLTKYVTLPLAAGFGAATKVGMDFQEQMSRVEAISGATAGEMKKLTEQAKELGAETAFSAKECAEGMENLASAGFDANETLKAMPGLMDLAAVSGRDVGAAAEYASSAIRQFNLKADKAGHVADVFARAAADTNAETVDMGYALKYAGTAANTAGWSLEETAAAIGIMSDAGIKGEQAGTTLRGALTRLMKPTKAMYEKFEELGIAINNYDGSMKSSSELIREFREKTAGLADDQKNNALATIFGTNALSGMLALVQAGPEKMEKMTEALENSDGSAKEMAKTMQNNLKNALEQLGGALETLGIEIFEQKSDSMVNVIETLTDWVTKLTKALQDMPDWAADLFLNIATGLAAIGPSLWIVGKLSSGLSTMAKGFKAIKGGAETLGGAFKVLGGALMGHPLILMAVVIGLLAGAFYYAYKNCKPFRDAVDGVAKAIKDVVSGSIKKFKEDLKEIGEKAKQAKEWFKELGKGISDAWNGMVEGVKSIPEKIANAWKDMATRISEEFEHAKTMATLKAQGMWSDIKTAFYKGIQWLLKPFGGLYAGIKGAMDGVSNFLSVTWDAIVKVAKEAWNILKGVVMAPVLFLCDMIMGDFGQLKEDMKMIWDELTGSIKVIWDTLVSWFEQSFQAWEQIWSSVWYAISETASRFWGYICDFISNTWESLKTTVTESWKKFKNDLVSIWEGLKTTVTESWDKFKKDLSNIWKGLCDTVTNSWRKFKKDISDIWEGLKSTVTNSWNKFKADLESVWTGLVDGAKRAWEGICEWFGKVREIDLWEAGKEIMQGFLDGLTSAWGKVKEFVGGIADWIREHKGPISYDKRLLIPAGKAIMDGLLIGLEGQFGAVQSFVSDIASTIAETAMADGISDTINSVNPTATIDRNTNARVVHELSGNKVQPAYVTLNMGGQEYKAFVSDIFNEHEQSADIRLGIF